jgi:multidrug resistance efflux pump
MDAPGALKKIARKVPTLGLVLVAAIVMLVLYNRWTRQPWTRDGQVRADIVKVAPRVMGYVVEVAVQDNQFVRKGELLFKIDPSSFQLSVDVAQTQLDQARQDVASMEAGVSASQAQVRQARAGVTSARSQIGASQADLESANAEVRKAEAGVASARAVIAQSEAYVEEANREATRARRLADQAAGSIESAQSKEASFAAQQAQLESAKADSNEAQAELAKAIAGVGQAEANLVIAENGLSEASAKLDAAVANLEQAKANLGQPGDANVRVREAVVQLEEARLKLSWTAMTAPFDGYITNLDVNEGAFGFPGIPIAAFVDSSSFRVDGYFQETKLKHINPGDRAIITLMSHPDVKLKGVVNSIGYAIDPPDIADTEGVSNLVPQVEPTFDWVRLPQRVPVRIRLEDVPQDIQLISGTTASVAIRPSRED